MSQSQLIHKVTPFQLNPEHHLSETSACQSQQKYTEWTLHKVHQQICAKDNQCYRIMYVGVGNLGIEGFLYGALNAVMDSSGGGGAGYVRFKFGMYEIGRILLSEKEQTGLVQALSQVKYVHNLGNFMRHNQELINIFKKLVQNNSHKYQQKKSFLHQKEFSTFQKLKQFCKSFEFLKYNQISKNIAEIKIFNIKFYIVKQKKIVFVFQKEHQLTEKPVSNLKQISLEINHKSFQDKNSNEEYQLKEKTNRKNCQKAVPKFLQTNCKKQKKQLRYTQQPVIKAEQNQPNQFHTPQKIDETIKIDQSQKIFMHYKLPQFLDARASIQSNPSFEQEMTQTFKAKRKPSQANHKSFLNKNQISKLKSSKLEPRKSKNSQQKRQQRNPHQISLQQKSFEKFTKKQKLKKVQLSFRKFPGQNKNSSIENIAIKSNSASKYKTLSPKSHSFLFTDKKKVGNINAE